MGSCSSRARPHSEGLFSTPGQGQYEQHAPMWVIRVGHVLEMAGTFPPHQVLKAQGLLEIWMSPMSTIFVSHQWLHSHHPDPNGEKLKVLQVVLEKLIAQELVIKGDATAEFYEGKLAAISVNLTREWYMWLDYFCVPQLIDGQATHGLEEDQALYVKSIASYVDLCRLFVALVPWTVHHDTGTVYDLNSWLERGWCRMELWIYHLSTTAKTPIIAVKSPHTVRFTAPLWHQYPVHTGDFAVEVDRASCCDIIQAALSQHVSKLHQSNKTAYRLYLALFEDMTGLHRKLRYIDEFLEEFVFFPKPLEHYKGLGPVACAALSGDEELVHSLAIAKASIHTRAPAMPETLAVPGLTPLHLVLWFKSHDVRVLATLLELRADPNDSTIQAPPPLGFCRTVGAVNLLVSNSAGVNFPGKTMGGPSPLHMVAGCGAPCEVLARLLELRADVHAGREGLANQSPLHAVAYCSDSKNDLRNAQLLVEQKADVNSVVKPQGLFRMLELMCRAYIRCRGETGLGVRFFGHLSTTPLGWCALLDNHGILTFLLRARADPEIRGNMGLRPIDMARSETIRAILRDPSPHIYVLEHNSDPVSEIM